MSVQKGSGAGRQFSWASVQLGNRAERRGVEGLSGLAVGRGRATIGPCEAGRRAGWDGG